MADGDQQPQRKRGWRVVLTVVVAVVALVAAAAAGLVVGRSTAPAPAVIVQQEPVVEQSAATPTLPADVLGPAPAATPSPTAPALAVGVTQPGQWPVELTAAPELPDDATTASGYRLAKAGISPAQVAAVLAGVFGVSGTPRSQADGFVVGSAGGPTLSVSNDAAVSWSYADPAATASPAAGPQFDPGKAIELATGLLGTIGVDTTTVDWQVDRYAGRTTAIAWQLVEGARTQLAWRVSFDATGAVVEASGFSAGIEEVPGYPVVGAATAVTRSATPPWSAVGPTLLKAAPEGSGAPSPLALPTAGGAASGSSSASTTPTAEATPAPGRPAIDVPVTGVTVTGATLGLAQYRQPDGTLIMLPAYTLTGSDGSRWSLLAVAAPYVQFVNEPYPMPSPAAR